MLNWAAMTEPTFRDSPVPVRDDILAAHRSAWRRLARPGTWWTGSERVAIAAEVRSAWQCSLCARRKAALSAAAIDGEHDALGALRDAAVDAIHRVVTDPGRLSRPWFEKTLASGLSDAEYVELIGVVVTVVSIDSFCRGLGVPLHPLPEAEPGEPTRRRPPGARAGEAWLPMIPNAGAARDDADIYAGAPTVPNVIRALSLVPDEVRGLRELSTAHYLPVEQIVDPTASRSLDRTQIELIAGRVSALNECFY